MHVNVCVCVCVCVCECVRSLFELGQGLEVIQLHHLLGGRAAVLDHAHTGLVEAELRRMGTRSLCVCVCVCTLFLFY